MAVCHASGWGRHERCLPAMPQNGGAMRGGGPPCLMKGCHVRWRRHERSAMSGCQAILRHDDFCCAASACLTGHTSDMWSFEPCAGLGVYFASVKQFIYVALLLRCVPCTLDMLLPSSTLLGAVPMQGMHMLLHVVSFAWPAPGKWSAPSHPRLACAAHVACISPWGHALPLPCFVMTYFSLHVH